MATSVSLVRRAAASGALVAAGGAIAAATLTSQWVLWPLVASALGICVAGIGLSQRRLLVQVVSRAVAWLVLIPSALVFGYSALRGTPELVTGITAIGSGASLLLSRPMLHTDEARAAFDPVRGRSFFLAGATLASMAAVITALAATLIASDGAWAIGAGVAAISSAYLASAAAVLRMRAWGVLLGGLMSALSVLGALVVHNEASVLLALAALPGMFFGAPVIAARLGADPKEPTAVRVRVAADENVAQMRVSETADDIAEAPAPAAKMTI